MPPAPTDPIPEARALVVRRLLAERGPEGHWTGELSSSALSTAVATIALGERLRRRATSPAADQALVDGGLQWLAQHANADGGWGDTLQSRSNLSTTALVWAAFGAAGADGSHALAVERAEGWLRKAAGQLEDLVPAIEGRYGKDRTFSVPIVMTLALSGRLGPQGWRRVKPLPFELAALPRSWFGALQLPVVSYALPALIALGQAIHHQAPSSNPVARILRSATARTTLHRLIGLQPETGGFLEATPLTAFVTMALASMNQGDHPVARHAAEFLRRSVRDDGSWPIDTNLATWTTTLAVKALVRNPGALPAPDRATIRRWLLAQQYRVTHPYTGAAPGGWAWTDLAGGVPDADDTAGALLALRALETPGPTDPATVAAAEAGVCWLLGLQNRDGGIPTFCRGWGTLPFDRSAPELTAHALRAWQAWETGLSASTRERVAAARARAHRFLTQSQRRDGSWVPLWFGNEQVAEDENPVFGTSLVLLALPTLGPRERNAPTWERAGRYLVAAQNPDGTWGGGPGVTGSVEETSLAVSALRGFTDGDAALAAARGREALARRFLDGPPAPRPIGLYFARLWYHERLYPWVFAAEALSP